MKRSARLEMSYLYKTVNILQKHSRTLQSDHRTRSSWLLSQRAKFPNRVGKMTDKISDEALGLAQG